MKRIITYLIVLLVTLPVIGQKINEGDQKFERFKKHKVINDFKNDAMDKYNNHYHVIVNKTEISKINTADKYSLDSLITHEWDANISQWKPTRMEEFTYDTEENIDTEILSVWSSLNSKWKPLQKYEYTFNTNSNVASQLTYFQYSPTQWTLSEKYEYTYDTNGNLTQIKTFVWDLMNNQWINSYKYEYSYDSNENMILETGFEWSQNQYVNSYKDELTYNMSNNLTSEYNYYWNWGLSQWDLNSKWDYAYNTSNNLISEISSLWDGSQWVNSNKYEYTYSSGGHLTVEIFSMWNINTNSWGFYYKDEYQYDSNNNLTIDTNFDWNETLSEWVQSSKDEFIFDLAYDKSDLIIPYFYEDALAFFSFGYSNMMIGYRGYEYENLTWIYSDKMILYYSNYSNPLNINDEIISKSISLYPNPVHDILIINSEIPLTKVEIYSLLGKKVTEVTTNFDAIQVNNLSNGIYILKIFSEKGSTSRKLIKR